MIKLFTILPAFALVLLTQYANGQTCSSSIDFGSSAFSYTGDIVNNSSGNTTNSLSYDLWNDNGTTTTSCTSTGGSNDMTIEFTSNTGVNTYTGGSVQNSLTATNVDIKQTTLGFVSAIQYGTSGIYSAYPGETRSQQMKVTFASHVVIKASDFNVQYSSASSALTTFESVSIVFLNASGNPYSNVTYNGYYGSGSNPAVAACNTSGISPGTPFTGSGAGSWLAYSTGSVSTSTNNCSATSGSNGSNNDKTINAQSDAGLNANDVITGFIWVHRLENVQGAASTTTVSSPSSGPTATLKGFSVTTLPLPVELIQFSALKQTDGVLLNWATASEINNDYFDIERSINGIDFEQIGRLAGSGTTSEIRKYSFTDRETRSSSYYRLKQVDFDGAFEFSPVIKYSVNAEMTIVRETADEWVVNGISEHAIDYFITTSNGTLVSKGSFKTDLIVEKSSYKAGVYFLTIVVNSTPKTYKWIKLE